VCPVRFEQDYDAERARDSVQWFGGALGRRVEETEMQLLRTRIGDLFGAQGALLGPCNDARVLDALQVQHRIFAQVSSAGPTAGAHTGVTAVSTTVVDPGNLPFRNGALDTLILFHALDIAAEPHGCLREAARVLSDQGRLVITGFNPFSLWGIRRTLARSRARAPWNSNFISPLRLFDWLSLLELRIESVDYVLHRPPFSGTRMGLFDWPALARFGRRLSLPLGGVYVVKAGRSVSARLRIDAPSARQRPPAAPAARPAGLGQAARGAVRHREAS